MLIEFRAANHRSISSEQVLSLEDGDSEGAPGELHLTRVAALYGANASGKSNFLSALQFMTDAVVLSQRLWAPDGGVPREPFAWGPKRVEPTLVEVAILIDGVRHEYGFVADDERILEEWLYVWPHKRKQVWFERDGSSFEFGDHLKGENRVSEKLTRANSLFLSAAVQNGHEQLVTVFRWFRRLRTRNVRRHGRARTPGVVLEESLPRWLAGSGAHPDQEQEQKRFARLRELVAAADVGIVGVQLRTDSSEDASAMRGRRRVYLQHVRDDAESWLALEEESAGTQQLLRMAPSFLDTLMRGGVLVVDELEASLHPLLALHLVRAFNDPSKNTTGAQLIFSTHDTHLLGTQLGQPALQRSQVWLSEKDDQGGTQVYPLTDFKPRTEENLERGYLQGRYGAIPFLGELADRKRKP